MKKHNILKKLMAAVLSAAMLAGAGVTASAASVADFTDVSTKAWYYNAVEYAADNSLFQGTSPSTFSPNGAMDRGMFVTVLSRQAKIDESQYLLYRFNDVKQGRYYAPAVEWAARYGIVSGTGKKTFSPTQRVTREQMATFLYRYAKATGNDTSYSEEAYNSFPDAGKVSSFAVEAMKWATDKKIINGSDGKLNPQGTATRAQVAQVFLNAKDILISTTMVVEPQMPEEEPAGPSTDSKAHPNNVFNVFAREYSAANDWQVSGKNNVDPAIQQQLIDGLKGKTGNAVWNEIALKGAKFGNIGATRRETFIVGAGTVNESESFTRPATVDTMIAAILKELERSPDVKYFNVQLEDFTDSAGTTFKDLYYEIYFINTPNASVDSADSAFTAKVKKLVAERLPSGFVWSKAAESGGWSDYIFLPPALELNEDQLAESYADFFAGMLLDGWGTGSEGKVFYYIALAPDKDPQTGNNGHEPLRVYIL